MNLLIAIPALNEEESIESIIQRTLDARDFICQNSGVTNVEVTVVSDGSTDRTVEIAGRYADQINLIVFEKNRGYGAAIKEAWLRSSADTLGFLDADGTCDPRFFAQLCQTLEVEDADVVLGCRLNPGSKMPPLRRVGNVLFGTLLSILSSSSVRDTASGMRVVRRSSLPRLMPLPDGLHFTPAMSARALLREDLKIVEIPMSYSERAGESKLRAGKDGLRFLRVILETALLYRPSRPLWLLGALCIIVACCLMAMPTLYYATHQSVEEWMIYRFVVSNLLGTCGCLLLCCAHLCQRIVGIALPPSEGGASVETGARIYRGRWSLLLPLALLFAGGMLVLPAFFQLVRTGATYEHWSRFIAMSFFFEVAIILLITMMVDYSLTLIAAQVRYLASVGRC